MMVHFPNKFCSKAKMLVPAVVLIFLSVLISESAMEIRKCYWCGPLAEQVHRKARAPSCTDPLVNVTECDRGTRYCAVIASSPPFEESRICAKVYRDECYTQYCNSTNVYRIICPCHGDLCNGKKTEREVEAFSKLPELLAESMNTRNKRTLVSTPSFISSKRYNIGNETNFIEVNVTINNNDFADEDKIKAGKTENAVPDFKTNNKADLNKTEITKTINDNNRTENANENMENIGVNDTISAVTETIDSSNTTGNETSQTTTHEYTQNHDKENTVSVVTDLTTEKSTENNNLHNTIQEYTQNKDTSKATTLAKTDMNNENKTSNDNSQTVPVTGNHDKENTVSTVTEASNARSSPKLNVETTMQETKLNKSTNSVTTTQVTTTLRHEESTAKHLQNPSKELPTAEALQQNTGPTEKTSETATTESTTKNIETTTNKIVTPDTTGKRNTATCHNIQVLILILSILLQNYV